MTGGAVMTGAAEARGNLASLSRRLRNKIIRKAVGAGGAVFRSIMRAKASGRGYDTIAKSISKKEKTYKGNNVTVSVVGPRSDFERMVARSDRATMALEKPANIAHLVELGVAPHTIGKGSKRAARKVGDTVKQLGGKHPGFAPRPFMRPAYDEGKDAAQTAVQAKLRAEIASGVKS